MYQGSCLCGNVKFSFKEVKGDFVYCHCKSCRKASGANAGVNIAVPIEGFTLIEGEAHIKTFESSPLKVRHFCSNCGSPLYTKVGSNPKYLRIRAGTLDTDYKHLPKAHIFLSHRAKWDEPNQSILEFSEWPDLTQVDIPGSHQPK